MSAGGNRRELRRRLLQAAPADSARLPPSQTAGGVARAAPYAAEALPDRHPSFATRIPSGRVALWGISLAMVALNALVSLVVLEARPGRSMAPPQRMRPSAERGRFDRTLEIVTEAFRSPAAPPVAAGAVHGLPPLKLPDWMGQTSLLTAAAVAVAVRQMRRHRLDDFLGHYRAWGWLTGLVVLTAIARQLPLGLTVGAIASDAIGWAIGPAGIGWWLLVSLSAWLGVVGWCLVPMQRRVVSIGWFVLAWAAWLAGAAIDAAIRSGQPIAEWLRLAGSLAITAGDTFLLVAMLWTFRTVLREVRGELTISPGSRPGEPGGGRQARPDGPSPRSREKAVEEDGDTCGNGAAARSQPAAIAAFTGAGVDSAEGSGPEEWVGDGDADDDADDGHGPSSVGSGGRKLSKAERRRLRKQARLDRAA